MDIKQDMECCGNCNNSLLVDSILYCGMCANKKAKPVHPAYVCEDDWVEDQYNKEGRRRLSL